MGGGEDPTPPPTDLRWRAYDLLSENQSDSSAFSENNDVRPPESPIVAGTRSEIAAVLDEMQSGNSPSLHYLNQLLSRIYVLLSNLD